MTQLALDAETIYALATPAGRGAVAIVRLSGAGSGKALITLTGAALPQMRQAVLRRLRGGSGETLDQALVLWLPGPGSFTGEDSAELHLHGGAAVIAGVCERLEDLGLRVARAGEFTRRAFENGRLDLSQAEAIADLIEAESGAQRRQALAQLGGALSQRFESWRETLLDALALLEADIDFADEDIPASLGQEAVDPVSRVLAELQVGAAETRGERVRQGFRIALIGGPNVGKSSLLNAISAREAAIVTHIPGTTRDVVEVSLIIGGQLVVLADTAGLRDTDDYIEAEGVRRAEAWSKAADLRIAVADQTRPETLEIAIQQLQHGDVLALNKSDLSRELQPRLEIGCPVETWATSDGIGQLLQLLAARVAAALCPSEFPAVTRSRHRALLNEAIIHLQRALGDMARGAELGAENVRLALRSLEMVTGRTNPEAVLDRVFAKFCIGK